MSQTLKADIRKIALKKRKKIYENLCHDQCSQSITSFFHEWIFGKNAISVVGLYYPINCETNTFSLIDYLFILLKEIDTLFHFLKLFFFLFL